MNHITYEERYAAHPQDVKGYDTDRLREHFLIDTIFEADKILLTYTMNDRFIAGGAVPVSKSLSLDPIDPLKAEHFCDRREVGIINIGGEGVVEVDGKEIVLLPMEGIYIGAGTKTIVLKSKSDSNPAKYYINSAPAHQPFPTKKIELEVSGIQCLHTHIIAVWKCICISIYQKSMQFVTLWVKLHKPDMYG